MGAAVVILALLRLRAAARRVPGAGSGLALLLVGYVVVMALGSLSSAPPAVGHLPPSFDPGSVSAAIGPIQTRWGIRQPIVVGFSAPMDAASVEAALRITPRGDVRLTWDASGARLSVAPAESWTPGAIYTVSVGPGARSLGGAALEPMAPAIVAVRPPATVTLEPTGLVGERVGLDSGVRLTFSRQVDLVSLRDAFTISPAVDGAFALEGSETPMPAVVWLPSRPLDPDTTYTISFGRTAVDTEGAAVAPPETLTVETIARPEVVRFRPRHKSEGAPPEQLLSVRFTEPMEHASTRAAYHLSLVASDGSKAEVDLSGAKVRWAENDTVLVIDPPKALAYGRTYVAEVRASARSQAGAAIADGSGSASSARFTIEPKPAPARSATSSSSSSSSSGSSSGGTSSGTSTAPWLAVEKYYLTLLNCTHTGGWLRSDGSCRGYGSNGLPALKLDSSLSTCASRPWAKYLAETGQLYHGDVGGRFARCGYNVNWGENLTSNRYDPYYGAISSVLFFQSEKGTSYDGHYVALMNPRYTHVGIGVWRVGGRNCYVVDFWGPF